MGVGVDQPRPHRPEPVRTESPFRVGHTFIVRQPLQGFVAGRALPGHPGRTLYGALEAALPAIPAVGPRFLRARFGSVSKHHRRPG